MRRCFPAICLGCLATLLLMPAGAQTVSPCDWRARADVLAEPWEKNSRTFSNGAVRVALLDMIEPAAAALHLLVLSPPEGPLGERQCRIVSLEGSRGFASLDLAKLRARYDPVVGLVLKLPAGAHDGISALTRRGVLSVTINQTSGAVKARFEERVE